MKMLNRKTKEITKQNICECVRGGEKRKEKRETTKTTYKRVEFMFSEHTTRRQLSTSE